MARFGLPALRRPPRSPAPPSGATRPARCWPAARALDAVAARAGERGLRHGAGGWARTPSAGRWRAAARSGSPRRSPHTCARSAGRSRRGGASRRSPSCARGPDDAPRRHAAPAPRDRRPRAAAALLDAPREATATGPASSSSTGPSTAPIPWTPPRCARAGTVHLGGTLAEIAASEAQVARRAPGRSVRAARPAEPLRPDARARGQAHRLGLLPCAERLARAT